MNKMILINGYSIDIEDGASLRRIVHIAENEEAALAVCEEITTENLKHVEFKKGEETYGHYDNMISEEAPARSTGEDGKVTVIISLRQKTSIELRLDELEKTQAELIEKQETQDEAIADLGAVTSALSEGK